MRKPFRTCLSIVFSVLAFLILALVCIAIYLDLHLYLRPIPSDLDSALRQQMEAAKLPGMAVAGIQDGKIVFAQGYGYANLEEKRPVTPDTLFQIASVSKLVTASAMMRLYEEGEFGLDDDINTYLPFSVRNPRYPETPITFRMLLAHTASIADGPSYGETYTLGESEDSPIALGDYLSGYFTPGGVYADAENNFSKSQPGTTYEYSNVGFGLVGYLVERISGEPFDQFCQQEVFDPLGMTSTHWFHRQVDKTRWAMPYGYDMIRRTYTPLGAYSFANYPDGALKTSVNDFARFLFPFMNNGQTPDRQPFLQPATIAEMFKVQYPQSGGSVGLAWHMDSEAGTYEHGGGDPGVSTQIALIPDKNIGLIIFANAGGEEGIRSTLGFIALVKNIYPLLVQYIEQQ